MRVDDLAKLAESVDAAIPDRGEERRRNDPRRGRQVLRNPTEQNVALAFAVLHQDGLRFCAQRGCWYEWDGTRWRQEPTGLALDFASDLRVHRIMAAKPDRSAQRSHVASKPWPA